MGRGGLISVLAGCVLACGEGGAEPARTLVGLGNNCSATVECAEGTCENVSRGAYECTRACEVDADCIPQIESPGAPGDEDLVCGVARDGARRCVRRCPFHESYVCVDGISTACEVADDFHCETCGCPDGLRCESGVGCLPLSDVDGRCRHGDDCTSGNCSRYAFVCRVAVGEPCTADDCDYCLTSGERSYCSAECGGKDSCGGDPCLSGGSDACTSDGDCSFCRTLCSDALDETCPQRCEAFSWGPGLGGAYYCDLPGAQAPRPLGARCRSNTQCASNRCWALFCVDGCTRDADCGEHGRCVDVPCMGTSTANCGPTCLPACAGVCSDRFTSDWCKAHERIEGGTAEVCDPRIEAGEACTDDASCTSGSCLNRTCE